MKLAFLGNCFVIFVQATEHAEFVCDSTEAENSRQPTNNPTRGLFGNFPLNILHEDESENKKPYKSYNPAVALQVRWVLQFPQRDWIP